MMLLILIANLIFHLQFTAIGGFGVGYLELITLIMCPLYCKPEDIGLASGFLGSAKQVAGTIASEALSFSYILHYDQNSSFMLST